MWGSNPGTGLPSSISSLPTSHFSPPLPSPLQHTQVLSGRDGLAKHLYSQLFGWIVGCINNKMAAPSNSSSFIGVLDIYG